MSELTEERLDELQAQFQTSPGAYSVELELLAEVRRLRDELAQKVHLISLAYYVNRQLLYPAVVDWVKREDIVLPITEEERELVARLTSSPTVK